MTSNDVFFVTRPPCFVLHFFTDECIGAPSPDILNIAQWVEISVDDVIVHAVTIDQLIFRLRKVFERCRERNLKLNQKSKKCEFGLTEIPVLGYVVSVKGIQPDPGKT